MPAIITEDQIEQGMVQRLQHLYGYNALDCNTADPADLNDGSNRRDKREVVFHDRLKRAAVALNPGIPESAIDEALKQICDRRQAMTMVAANRELEQLIHDGVRVEFRDEQGRNRTERVRVIDFTAPASPHNHFLVVTQLWVQSTGTAARARYRRPDVLLYVNGLPLKLTYHSLSSGETEREIVPFALIDNGLRWHVRAFDRRSKDFRDFVITRMQRTAMLKDRDVLPHEKSDQDIQWTRIVELELVPHPDQPRPEIAEMDYGMTGGMVKMKLRAATAGYILRKWSVDCSADHGLRGPEYRLWLKDHLALYGVKNAVLAPGYAPLDAARAGAECD